MSSMRDLFLTSALCLLVATSAFGQAQPQTAPGPEARLLEALQRNRLAITMGDGPSGPGWDWLVQEARAARFTLIGEEHGVAETARFSAALFNALRASGYDRLAIELSPPIADDIETAARNNGVEGIVGVLTSPGAFTFYNQREEAQFLADIVKTAPTNERVLRGLDREIFSDRYLISRLESRVPRGASAAFARLKDASSKAWARYEETQNPDDMFILGEDPALVSAVRAAWPHPDHESDLILRTLEGSLAIEAAERAGGAWPYFQRRVQWNRDNLAALLKAQQARKVPGKIMMRFGYSHMIRGANYFNVFDLGAMADEAAALTGERAFHILVLPGPGSQQAVLGPNFSFVPTPSDEFDELKAGDKRLTRVLSNPNATGHEVIDLRALRPLAIRGLESWNSDLIRTVHGYDAVVIWKSAHASSSLK